MAGYGYLTRMHVVRLRAPPVDDEDHSKDVDFKQTGIREPWQGENTSTKHVALAFDWPPLKV